MIPPNRQDPWPAMMDPRVRPWKRWDGMCRLELQEEAAGGGAAHAMTKSTPDDRAMSMSIPGIDALDDAMADLSPQHEREAAGDGTKGSCQPAMQPSANASASTALWRQILAKKSHPRTLPEDAKKSLQHDGNNASIVLDEDIVTTGTPWTPKSLGRAKSAIVYKQTLNDTLLVMQRNIFFFSDWVPYFFSLQEDHVLMYTSREKWEQGLKPDRVIQLTHTMMLSDMKVDLVEGGSVDDDQYPSVRIFRRRLLETDEIDEWLNEQLRQSLVVDGGSSVDGIMANNPNASARAVIEFASYNQNTFELWTKSLRRVLNIKREEHLNGSKNSNNNANGGDTLDTDFSSDLRSSKREWVSPGRDSKVTLHQSEVWCNRVTSGDKDKAESEMRRIIAMEKLVCQVTSPRMALLVYEKVSRVHELFVSNSRREIEGLDGREKPMSAEALNFFADHLKRKYSVFLILALAYGVGEEQIREAHEQMCVENSAYNAGVGGGSGEQAREVSSYGFDDQESIELYEKYRDAALNYFKMNYADPAAAEEEDAIMHLPVMLQVAVIRRDDEEVSAMMSILDTHKWYVLVRVVSVAMAHGGGVGRDAIVVGGGHNGLVAASYLAKAGKRVCVLEKRHLVGGAAVTEEIIPGFKFSRASYVFSLFRPQIIKDLDLHRHGLEVYPRDPSSFTPTLDGRNLLLGSDMKKNQESIAQFSRADAIAFPKYCEMLDKMVGFFTPMIDELPPDVRVVFNSNTPLSRRVDAIQSMMRLGYRSGKLGKELTTFLEFMTAPATKILGKWFESEVLKTTLATDAIIGAKVSPSTPGSAYILFHHVRGEVNGVKGMWGHVKGGMGEVTQSLLRAAEELGVEVQTNAVVKSINVHDGKVHGVCLDDGQVLESDYVLSNASPMITMLDLIDQQELPDRVKTHFKKNWNCESASTKINVALDRLPNFRCLPNSGDGNTPMPHHRGTTHFEETMDQIEQAFLDVQHGYASKRPVIEMNIPTSLDASIAPPGKHVALLFVQYTPYLPKVTMDVPLERDNSNECILTIIQDGSWETAGKREMFAERVFSIIDQYAPGFKNSIIGYDMLTPPDLERIFSLPRGNIFHGAMGLDQMFWMRPIPGYADYRSAVKGLYMCSAGTHPGGGVMGACGRNSAMVCLKDMSIK
ncbi:TPA: hypothetical protein N0F65_001585 [Lagenidium giganteum]|uniref:Pyridine nucleotide-disulfide oxidoreductase domain-containing protein 2 n=1 Tax=Lagenidium giganteum TaxID=4803 RepID=A0AAV2Z1X9_9STRA|nr:TPA: hypothetical protein N0F65_001585 [Lagenidium giganteum]